ncbi:MAG: hypothetical protein HOC23_19610 [Halieaceae bacterium]|jgi:hypothetical protein|nr:hypothetical protein [Halieaceae bacterium]
MTSRTHLFRFVGLVFVWLIPCFALWMSLGSPVTWPAVRASEMLLTAWMPGLVSSFTLSGTDALLLTQYGELNGEIVAARTAGYNLGFHLNTRILSYSLPFYAALHFATPQDNSGTRFMFGLMVLYPLLILCLVSLGLKTLMVELGPVFASQTVSLLPNQEAIAIMYQISTLIIPPLAPVLVWAWQSQTNPKLLALLSDKPAPIPGN